MNTRPYLVTGATGLVGNNVVRALLERGQTVRVLTRPTADPRPLSGLDVETIAGDVRDPDAVARAVQGARTVIHAAGLVYLGWTRLAEQRAINVDGTRHIADSARQLGIRLIHVSTCDTVYARSTTEPADEEAPWPLEAVVPYVVTKCEAEQVVRQEIDRGLDAVIVNPAFMLGPWDWKPSSGQMLLEVSQGRGLLAPRGSFSVCDVRDVAEAAIAAVERAPAGRRYILAGDTITYLAAWRVFAEVTGSRKPIAAAGPLALALAGSAGDLWGRLTGREPLLNSAATRLAGSLKHYTSRRAEQELGYRRRPVRDSAADAWKWFLEHGYASRSR